MTFPQTKSARGRALLPVAGLALAAGSLLATPAAAGTPCTAAALTALKVPGLTIATATAVAAAAPNPAFCDVQGSVTTSGFGAPNGTAQFEFKLPATWNGKFLFWGVGGFAGTTQSLATNSFDPVDALAEGYATAVTDTGHESVSETDASWAITAPGVPDQAKITDYYFRATHEVALAGKAFTRAFYGAPSIQKAYFDGCSNGGRQAFVEATQFPEDFDGIIAGDPFLDIRSLLAGLNFQKQQLTPQTFIPATLLPQIDAAIRASCDATDGVVDGLIQNPARCAFNPQSLVPSLLTQGQADTLNTYFTALRADDGHVIYTGASVSDISSPNPAAPSGMDLWSTGFIIPNFSAAEPWGGDGFGGTGAAIAPLGWQFVDHGLQFLVERQPGFNVRDFDAESPIGTIGAQALELFDQRTAAGDGDIPARLLPFILDGRKLLIYHGFSDPALNPYRTINEYLALSQLFPGGIRQLQDHVRLFMVPGMHHCAGGPGPNVFDTLTALDAWVEQGTAPDGIVATHFQNNTPPTVDRTMPLCVFPEKARYAGSGAVDAAQNWICTPNDDLLRSGPNGQQAGVGQQNDVFSTEQ
jgi:feruloyl esterase